MITEETRRALPELPVRDDVAALAAVGGDADLAQELLETLVATLPEEIEALRASYAEEDWPALAEHAHQMRGATRYCGVTALDDAAETLQRTATIGDRELIHRAFAQVESESERLLRTLGGRQPSLPG